MSSQTKFQPNRARNSDFSRMTLFKKIFLNKMFLKLEIMNFDY